MGFDLSAMPLHLDAEPVRRLLTDPDAFADAIDRPPFTNRTWGEPLPELNRALCAAHPGLSGWDRPYPDRSYEAAEFVLDPVAWRAAGGWDIRVRSLACRIILGDRALPEHVWDGQGVRWRASGPAFLRRAADTIEGLDLAAARREFDVRRMGAYKVSEHDDEAELFARVTNNLAGLAAYYRRVADRGLDLVIRKD